MAILKIGGATLNQTPLDWEGNVGNIITGISLAKKSGIDILNLPELCISGYGCEDMFLAPWVCHKSLNLVDTIVPHTEAIATVVGLPLLFDGKV